MEVAYHMIKRMIAMSRLNLAFVIMLCISLATMLTEASDFTLEIFGNANVDDTIDGDDIAYVENIIKGTNEATELADANYDGEINEDDIAQIELIISGEDAELTILDDTVSETYPEGRAIKISKPVERIVGLNANVPEALRILESGDKMVGISKSAAIRTKFLADISYLPIVAEDVEAIVSLSPDLVIGYGSTMTYSSLDIENQLKGIGIELIRLDLNRADTFVEDIAKLGYILDKRPEAIEFIDFYEGTMNLIDGRIDTLSDDQKPLVYIEFSSVSYRTVGKNAELHQVCTRGGGVNIATDLEGDYPTVDPEWVLDQNPDIIISVMFDTNNPDGYELDDQTRMEEIREEIINRPEFSDLSAVKNGNVFVIERNIGFVRHFIGVAYIAKLFHPELFDDLDPDAINKYYLENFQGVPYRGFYFYPAEVA